VRFFYLDASALSKRYAPEPGSSLLDHLFASVPPDRLLVLNVGMAEVVSVLVRKRNAGKIPGADFTQAMVEFAAEVIRAPAIRKVVADDALVNDAINLIDVHAVNATDALILRSALNAVVHLRAVGDDLVLVASDQRLLRAAQAEGLVTFDPENQGQTDLDALLAP
jgi:predicted nucleic acid-binding protein